MKVYLVVLLSILSSMTQRGSKVLVSLSALEAGASPFMVGVLAATFAVFPLLLAVYAGRTSDRLGVRLPIMMGATTMALGLYIPALNPQSLALLWLCPALAGLGHIFLHVSIHNAVGALGGKADRAKNFGTFALGASIATFIGPALAGFAIDHLGYRATFLIFGSIVFTAAILVLIFPKMVPTLAKSHAEKRGSLELLGNAGLRRTLIMSGVALTGIELFAFYFPIYGKSIGLSASWIGVVMSAYAAAAFVVRLLMGKLVLRYTEMGVLTFSLFIAALTYALIPLFGLPWALIALAFCLGLGLGTAQPLTIMLTYNHAPPGRSGEALGLRLTANKFTQLLVPLAFGSISTALGVAPVFWANALFLFSGGMISYLNRQTLQEAPHDAAKQAVDELEEPK